MDIEAKFPNITLSVGDDGLVSIDWHPQEGSSKRLITSSQSLDAMIGEMAEKIGIKETGIGRLWEMASEGDSLSVDFSVDTSEPDGLDYSLITKALVNYKQKYQNQNTGNGAVDDQLLRDWQCDILCAAVERLYDLFITQTLIYADDLAVETITLDDKSRNPRLAERMAMAMEDLGLNLYLPEYEDAEEKKD